VFNNQGSCVDVKSSANYKETALFKEIKDIENKLKDLPYLDLKVESKDIEDIINKAIQDLVANIEEHHELNEMINQINTENKETDEKIASVKRSKKSLRKKDMPPSLLTKSPSDEMLKTLTLKKSSKMIVQKKLMDLKIKNDDQKTMISTFIGNLCKQGKRSELEEKVIYFL
jgi:hypothetical protein